MINTTHLQNELLGKVLIDRFYLVLKGGENLKSRNKEMHVSMDNHEAHL